MRHKIEKGGKVRAYPCARKVADFSKFVRPYAFGIVVRLDITGSEERNDGSLRQLTFVKVSVRLVSSSGRS